MVLQSYQLPAKPLGNTKKEGNVGLLQGEERSPTEGSIFPTKPRFIYSPPRFAQCLPPPQGSLPGIPFQPTDPASLPVETSGSFVYFHLPGATITSTERLASLPAEVPKPRLENVGRNYLSGNRQGNLVLQRSELRRHSGQNHRL